MRHAVAPIRGLFIGLFVLLSPAAGQAAPFKLASYFGDHMVLQRDHQIAIWGDADPNSEVKVSVADQNVTATADKDGRWSAQLEPLKAGGPVTVSASSGDQTITLNDVLIGDVFLCSGQSNMQMQLKSCDDGLEVAAKAGELKTLRLCSVARAFHNDPQRDAAITWRTSTPESAGDFSAVAFYVGHELKNDPKLAEVPIGLIDSSFGGTLVEGWIPQEKLAKYDAKELGLSMFGIKPSMLYNAMIAPLGTSPVRGVVWYQGEGNAGKPQQYVGLLTTMIESWRERFNSPELPFVIVQLPDWSQPAGKYYWPWIRESQAKVASTVKNTHLAVGINTTDGLDLHPKEKHEIGRRVALLVRKNVYGEEIVAQGATPRDVTVKDGAIHITFDNAEGGLVNRGDGPVKGFAVGADDGKFAYADAVIDGSSVTVKSEAVRSPKFVRYAWSGVPESTLYNKANLTAAPFRTDSFTRTDIEVQKQSPPRRIQTPVYELIVNATGQFESLRVGGKQFLSSDVQRTGGAGIPGFFGPRALGKVGSPAPNTLECTDGELSMLLSFADAAITISFKNGGKTAERFQIALLTPQVQVSSDKFPGLVQLRRGGSLITVRDVDGINNTPDAKVLDIKIPASGAKTLELKIETGSGA